MGFSSIFILIILVLSMAFLIPSIILSLDGTDSANFQQRNGTQISVRGDLTSTVTNIDDTADTADISLMLNSDTVAINNLSEGETRTVQISGYNISVTLGLVISETTVSTSYEYPQYMQWPDGARYIIENTVLIIIIMALLLIVGLTLMSYKMGEE